MSWFNLARRLPALWQNERTRIQLLSGISVLTSISGFIAGYAFFREPLQVRLDHLTIHLPNAKGKLPAKGLRLLHLSDTHFRGADWREQAKIDCIRKACAQLEYDLLIHTGDFLHEDQGLPNVLTLLDALPAPRLGSYAVFGNHDYCIYSHDKFLTRAWANFQALYQADEAEPTTVNGNGTHNDGDNRSRNQDNSLKANEHLSKRVHGSTKHRTTPISRARTLYQFGQYCANAPLDFERTGSNDVNALESALSARNIQTLHTRSIRITDPEVGLDIYLAGVDDVQEGTPELERAMQDIPYDAPTILLSHNPDILVEGGIEQADLVLSGHTHGGQIVLPLIGAAHTQTEHLCRKEVSGYLRRGKTQVYITRGVGEGIPLRLGAAPQVTLITVLPA
jgi:predicted MPP superfamily phosphohydrolase